MLVRPLGTISSFVHGLHGLYPSWRNGDGEPSGPRCDRAQVQCIKPINVTRVVRVDWAEILSSVEGEGKPEYVTRIDHKIKDSVRVWSVPTS